MEWLHGNAANLNNKFLIPQLKQTIYSIKIGLKI